MGKITNDILKSVFWRTILVFQVSWNYEKMQGLGYCYSMMPALRVLYGDDDEAMRTALETHLGFFNTTPHMAHLILGANIALEEEVGMADPQAIISLKTGLMGPFAGIGDTIFVALYRAIVYSIAAYMALEGNVIGLLIPIITGIGIMWVRYKMTVIGYEQGRRLATTMADRLNEITELASIVGLTVVGALIPSVIGAKLSFDIVVGEVIINLQEQLDKIMPGLVPVIIVVFSYRMLRREKMTSTKLIWVLIGLGMFVGNIGNMLNYLFALFG